MRRMRRKNEDLHWCNQSHAALISAMHFQLRPQDPDRLETKLLILGVNDATAAVRKLSLPYSSRMKSEPLEHVCIQLFLIKHSLYTHNI